VGRCVTRPSEFHNWFPVRWLTANTVMDLTPWPCTRTPQIHRAIIVICSLMNLGGHRPVKADILLRSALHPAAGRNVVITEQHVNALSLRGTVGLDRDTLRARTEVSGTAKVGAREDRPSCQQEGSWPCLERSSASDAHGVSRLVRCMQRRADSWSAQGTRSLWVRRPGEG
jgi:hypothetical protein